MSFLCNLLCSLVILLYLSHECFGIKCWVCRSDEDPKCGDPFDNTTVPIADCKQERELKDIPGVKATMCRKIRQKVGNELITMRSCTWEGDDPGNGPCSSNSVSSYDKTEYCSMCSSHDGCNSAETLSATLPLLGAILICRYLADSN